MGEWANKWRIAPQPVASVVAQEMLFAQPYLVDKGMCVAIYDGDGAAVSMAPLGTVH